MNANELADELDKQETIASMTTLQKIATMLRQQQAEIDNLKYLNNEHRGVIDILMNEREVLRDELRKAQENG